MGDFNSFSGREKKQTKKTREQVYAYFNIDQEQKTKHRRIALVFPYLEQTEGAVASSEWVDEGVRFLALQRLCWPLYLKTQADISS